MDFGIARTRPRSNRPQASGEFKIGKIDAVARSKLSRERRRAVAGGAVVGTIGYMAPEQARGEAVDQRTDIYAYGLMLYDMLLGRHRVDQAGGAIPELQKRLAVAPPAPRTIKTEVPEPFDPLIAKCIEPDAAKRYQSTADLVAALDRLDDRGKLRPSQARRRSSALARPWSCCLVSRPGRCTTGVSHSAPRSTTGGRWCIADFANRRVMPLDQTLEPVLRRALERHGICERLRSRDAYARRAAARYHQRNRRA